MASAKKCDRCGKYYDKCTSVKRINGYQVKGINIFTSYGPYLELDLCEKCIDDLYDFLGIEEKK